MLNKCKLIFDEMADKWVNSLFTFDELTSIIPRFIPLKIHMKFPFRNEPKATLIRYRPFEAKFSKLTLES